MTSSIVFDGFDFTGVSPRGGQFKVREFGGWISIANRRDRVERSQQAGAWPSTGHAQSLPITMSGQATYGTELDAATERREIMALGGTGTAEMMVIDAMGVGMRQVELDSLIVSPIRDRMFTFSLVVTAPDPLLYGPPVTATTTLAATSGTGRTWARVWPRSWGVTAGTTPGAAALPNAGTAGYFPAFRLDGPMPNPVVTVNETGEFVRYAGTVAAGQWLEVDTARRRVLLNGSVDVTYRASSSATWPSIPPGGGSVSIAADAGDPAASLTAYGFEGAWT